MCNQLHIVKDEFKFLIAVINSFQLMVINYNTYVIDYMLSKVFKIILKAFQKVFWPLINDYILW